VIRVLSSGQENTYRSSTRSGLFFGTEYPIDILEVAWFLPCLGSSSNQTIRSTKVLQFEVAAIIS